jgi:hypothetical protein
MRNWNWGGAALAFVVGLAMCALGAKLGGNALGVLLGIAAIALVFKLTESRAARVVQDEDDDDQDDAGTVSSR